VNRRSFLSGLPAVLVAAALPASEALLAAPLATPVLYDVVTPEGMQAYNRLGSRKEILHRWIDDHGVPHGTVYSALIDPNGTFTVEGYVLDSDGHRVLIADHEVVTFRKTLAWRKPWTAEQQP
jgi:hypothetical protein